MKTKTNCCTLPSWAIKKIETPTGKITQVETKLSSLDIMGMVQCRLSDRFRSAYRITPGLYTIGNPTPESDILVSSNYKLTFDELRSHLDGLNLRLLILDTKGINVWCAAGKGTFGTDELLNRMHKEKVAQVVTHRRIILPQLGAPGVCAHEVQKQSGFSVVYGPVRASDISRYLQNNLAASPDMRRVTFKVAERAELIPMELVPAIKKGFIIILIIAAFMGLTIQGIIFSTAASLTLPVALALLSAIFAGAVLHPLLLPLFPFRAFTVQGALLGLIAAFPFVIHGELDLFCRIAIAVGAPMISSYLAFNFTGCTTFTNKSGVKKELKLALPVYIIAIVIIGIALIAYKISSGGFLP